MTKKKLRLSVRIHLCRALPKSVASSSSSSRTVRKEIEPIFQLVQTSCRKAEKIGCSSGTLIWEFIKKLGGNSS